MADDRMVITNVALRQLELCELAAAWRNLNVSAPVEVAVPGAFLLRTTRDSVSSATVHFWESA